MAKRNNDDDQSNENLDNLSDSDNFGLPDIEYKPLESTEEPVVEEKSSSDYQTQSTDPYKKADAPRANYSNYTYTEEKSNAPAVIGLIIVIVVVVAGYLIYNYVYKPQAEKAKQEQLAKEAERKRKEQAARDAKLREEEERKRREAELAEKNAEPAPGTITTLTDRTRRYYVVISSAIDDDLMMDYARKLSEKGQTLTIIPPFGKWKVYRLAIGDYDTFAAAQSNADNAKAQFGDGVWVIKY